MTPTELAELRTMSEWILRPSFYVEARVGSENHRGECCRALMNDARRNERADELLKKLARAFLSLLDAGELVRVKPLEWKLCNRTSIKTWRAETVFGELVVQSKYFWFANDGGGSGLECKSIADGKVKAEAHYRFRLAAALEPIIPMETNREAK